MSDYHRIHIDSYNHRRYGRPWAAQISLDVVNLSFDFIYGAFDGDWIGGDGDLLIPLQPDTVLAYGQKDNRGNKSEIHYLYCDEDLQITEVTKTEARNILIQQEAKAKP